MITTSQKGINPRYYKQTVTLERRVNSQDDTGDLIETWQVIQNLIPCSIQNLLVTELQQLNQGREFNADYKAYLPSNLVTFENGDRLTDNSGEKYTVIASELFTGSNNKVNVGHHYKLFLRIIKSAHT